MLGPGGRGLGPRLPDGQPRQHRVEGGQIWAMSGWTATDPQAAYDFVNSRRRLIMVSITDWSEVGEDRP